MNSPLQRYVAAVIGFGFVAVALTAGVGAALASTVAGATCYAAVALLQRRRLDRHTVEFMEERRRERSAAERQRRARADVRRGDARRAYG